MKAKPILIVRLSKTYPEKYIETISKNIIDKNTDYNVIVIYEGSEQTTFEVLNGEFTNTNKVFISESDINNIKS